MSGTDGYRYPGPNEFEDTPADHLLFSGREDEINAITQQIVSSRLLVLYGSSGLGKSSLLKAGVYPKLRESNFCPIRVRITDKISALQLLAQSCEETGREAGVDYTPGVGNTPWEFFKTAMFWRDEKLLQPVLVFDQFEEIFTTVRTQWKRDFANEIGPLATGNLPDSIRRRLEQGEKGLTDLPPQVKLIFSLREEFYGSLEEISADFPALFQDRFRLLPMDRTRAELAIRQPALRESQDGIVFHTPTFTYDDDTIRMMLGFLAGRHGTIEPFQLQLLCQHIERVIVPQKLRAGASSTIEITANDLGGERVMSDLVRRFYADSLAQLPVLQARHARELCDTGLLSSDGHRLMLRKDDILHDYKISEDTLKHLVDRRILREEPRLDSLFYEIGHDTIAQSILKTRRWRVPRKYRVPAWVAAVLILVSTPIFIVLGLRVHSANINLQHEIGQEKEATTNAKQAQGKAESLASYLIGEDLMDAIRPVARIDVLEGVQEQIKEQGLLGLNTTTNTSDRAIQIRGLAYLNQGDISYIEEKLTQANSEYEQARSAFQELVTRRQNNPEWFHNLADAEAKLGDVASDQYRLQDSLTHYQNALANIRLATEHQAGDADLSDKLKRDEAEIYQDIGGIYYQQRNFKDALLNLNKTVERASKKDHPQNIQWAYILEDGLVGEAAVYQSQGQEVEADKVLHAALKTAETSAHQNPFNPETQRRLGVAKNQLANLYIYRRAPEQVLDMYQDLKNIMQLAITWEPKNKRWQRDFAYSLLLIEEANEAAGHTSDSEELVQKAIQQFDGILKVDPTNASLMSDLADSHRDWGQLLLGEDPNAAVKHDAMALELLGELAKIDSANKSVVISMGSTLLYQAIAFRTAGHPDAAVKACSQGLTLINNLEQVDPSDTDYWETVSLLHETEGDALRDQHDYKGADLAYGNALNEINEAIKRAPSSSRYWNDLFLLRFEHISTAKNDPAQKLALDQLAFTDAKKATELDPGTSYYAYNLAQAQMHLGNDYKESHNTGTALRYYKDAESSYKQAIQTAGKLDAQNDREHLSSLIEKEILPLQLKDVQASKADLEELIQIRKDRMEAEPQTISYMADLAAAQAKLGDFLADGTPSAYYEASAYYTEAENSYRNANAAMAKTDPDKYSSDLQKVRFSEAQLAKANPGKNPSLSPYETMVADEKRLVAADPSNAGYRAKLAEAYRKAGDRLQEHNMLQEAKEFYENAEESLREAIRLQPNGDEWAQLGSLYYNSLAPLSEKLNAETAAFDFYENAADAESHAVTLDSANVTYFANVGYAYQAAGNVLVLQRNYSRAEQDYARSIEWFQKATGANSKNPLFWYGLALTSEDIAQMHEQNGNHTSAHREYEDAQTAIKKAIELDPKDKRYGDENNSISAKLTQLRPS